MTICALYPGQGCPESASRNVNITDICSDSKSVTPCPYCGDEGGFSWEDGEHYEPCPECGGSGYVEGEPEPLSIDDLDMRAPIDGLLAAWGELAAKGIRPGTRRRIAGHCDRRLSWQYRTSEC